MDYYKTTKSGVCTVRLDEDIRSILEKKAEGYKNKSECIRELIVSDKPYRSMEVRRQIAQLNYEINKIGVNINQIVKNFNSDFYLPDDKEQLVQNLDEIQKLQKDVILTIKGL